MTHHHGTLGGHAFYQNAEFEGEAEMASVSLQCGSEFCEMLTQDWAPRGGYR